MKIPVIIFVFMVLLPAALIIAVCVQKSHLTRLRKRLRESMRNVMEINNFLALYSKNLKTDQVIDSWMEVTAHYVQEAVRAKSICIFILDGEFLRPLGIAGPFPLLHKVSGQYVMTKPKHLQEQLRSERVPIGEGLVGETAKTRNAIYLPQVEEDTKLYMTDPLDPVESVMTVPIQSEGELSGVLCAVNNAEEQNAGFTPDQFSHLKFMASQVELALRIFTAYAHLSEKQRIDQELKFAKNLQNSLIPKTFPKWGRFSINAFTRSSKEVSGDFYDFVPIDDDRLLLVIGDACGKGIPACMIMAMTRSFIRANVDRYTNLIDLLQEVNDNLYRDMNDERYTTLACCVLNRHDSTIEYARGGHTEMMIYVHEHIRSIFPDGPGIGLMPGEYADFQSLSLEFTPGMSILLFTDGISEAESPEGEYFGIPRLRTLFRDSCMEGDSPEETIRKTIRTVENFSDTPGGEGQQDDQTMVIVRYE